jgi:hypothetical protein
MGMGSSPVPMGQHLYAQQTGMFSPAMQNAPRGPFAPVPANQALLQPLLPTTTGFNSFVPTRPMSTGSPCANPSPFANPAPQPSFMQSQPTGYPGAGMSQPSLMAQPTGFAGNSYMGNQQPSFAAPGLMSQPTGMPMGGFGAGPTAPMMSQPTGFAGGSMFQQNGSGFGGVQTSKFSRVASNWHTNEGPAQTPLA